MMPNAPRLTGFRRVVFAAAVVMAANAMVGAAPDGARTEKVKPVEALRALDRSLMDIIDRGVVRSPTLRALVAHLEHAHVIVYVAFSDSLSPGTMGRTRLMSASGVWRLLSIDLSDRLSQSELLALLGHELQHAVEIADAPEVVDDASLAALYRRIGSEERSGSRAGQLFFETDAAIVTGRRVYCEVFGSR